MAALLMAAYAAKQARRTAARSEVRMRARVMKDARQVLLAAAFVCVQRRPASHVQGGTAVGERQSL